MPSFYLVTYFGTIAYLDVATSMVRHGHIGQAPENLTVQINDDIGTLYTDAHGPLEAVGDLGPGGCRYTPADPGPCALTLRLHEVGRVTFGWAGRLLTAEEDGTVSLFRSMVGHWEIFLLLTAEDLAELKFVLQNSWLQRLPHRLFTLSDIRLGEGFRLAFAEHVVSLADMLHLLRQPVEKRPSSFLEIVVPFDGWKVLFLRLYRPLVYLVAYGSSELFGCAVLAVQSLRDFGRYTGSISLITDRDHADAAALGVGQDVQMLSMQAYDVLDFALARYRITKSPRVQQFQPILYIDTDVICNAPLDSLLQELCFSDALYALPEGELLTEADFYGRTLFTRDPGVGSRTDPGMSSGIMAFRNARCVEQAFSLIEESAYSFAQSVMRRDFFPAFDQPFANYVVYKGILAWKDLSRWAFGSSYVNEPDHSIDGRRGLIHFAGGVGNAGPKIERMRRYVKNITGGEDKSARPDPL